MKPQVDDVEDDLAAEEENKLINEVSERVPRDSCMLTQPQLQFSGIQNLVRNMHIVNSSDPTCPLKGRRMRRISTMLLLPMRWTGRV